MLNGLIFRTFIISVFILVKLLLAFYTKIILVLRNLLKYYKQHCPSLISLNKNDLNFWNFNYFLHLLEQTFRVFYLIHFFQRFGGGTQQYTVSVSIENLSSQQFITQEKIWVSQWVKQTDSEESSSFYRGRE